MNASNVDMRLGYLLGVLLARLEGAVDGLTLTRTSDWTKADRLSGRVARILSAAGAAERRPVVGTDVFDYYERARGWVESGMYALERADATPHETAHVPEPLGTLRLFVLQQLSAAGRAGLEWEQATRAATEGGAEDARETLLARVRHLLAVSSIDDADARYRDASGSCLPPGRLARSVWRLLSREPRTATASALPRVGIIDRTSRRVWLDGERTITNVRAFKVLEVLIAAHLKDPTRVVGWEEFDAVPGLKGARVDRIVRDHLSDLRQYILGEPGRGGGRYLRPPHTS